ncbi:MAG: 2-amino-4-hydroxy-6-hydroxymethyldihydropteridine diphosphokinase [Flavobacteriales bacterium]|nr:2-amino-4-hydroxy-6-hydroxymethyldihydropteridine diphosphokinase [Flavobacteriales bacterium]|tara:strand:- start:16244 stop:16741 length:498 start_codon:yes stop_codon:yes gene_type:complete
MYKTVYLGLGTNLGNKLENLKNALDALKLQFGTPLQVSSIYESKPWGFVSSSSFLNLVVSYKIQQKPRQTLKICRSLEKKLGRKEKTKEGYESRIIDIDILIFGNLIVQDDDLKIPHPEIKKRLFVLEPLMEICRDEYIFNEYNIFLTRIKKEEKIKKIRFPELF